MYSQEVDLDGSSRNGGIIVIEPGSFSLRFGVVDIDDLKPHSMTNCVAIRKESKLSQSKEDSSKLVEEKIDTNEEIAPSNGQSMNLNTNYEITDESKMEEELNETQTTQKSPKTRFTLLNGNRQVFESNSILDSELDAIEMMYDLDIEFNESQGENNVEILEKDNVEWTDISSYPDLIIGDDALYVDENDPYDIFFPFKYGQLNRSKGYSDVIILDMIHQIWEYALINHVGINVDEFNEYNVVLVIQDSYSKNDVRELIDVLIRKMNFNAVYIQKESVCVAVGSGQQSCCVVNIGFSHTTISCVEDCEILEGSNFTMSYGGIDVSKILLYQLNRNSKDTNFRYYKADIDNSVQDLIIFEEMKESLCQFSFKNITNKMYEFCERHRDKKTKLYKINIGNEQIISPLSLFHHKLLNVSSRVIIEDNDFSDQFDEYFAPTFIKDRESIPIRRAKISTKKMASKEVYEENVEENEVGSSTNENENLKLSNINIRLFIPDYLIDKFSISPLHIAIVDSISSVSQKRVRQKFYNHIILAGGGSMIEGLREFLEETVFDYAPGEVEKVEVSSIQNLGTPQSIAWRGAAITASQLPNELWLGNEEWKRKGVLILRKRLPFLWDNPLNKKCRK